MSTNDLPGSLSAAMAELDRVREQIAYLKYWQGIMVVTSISLIGWLITAATDAGVGVFALAFVAVIGLVFGVLALHRRIDRRIEYLGRL